MPLPWKSLCAPTDFSEAARPAFQAACELATHFDAELWLLFVQEPQSAYLDARVPEDVLEDLDTLGEQRLGEWKREAERRGVRRAHGVLVTGPVVEQIVSFAQQRQVDVIVMGTHGRTALRHLLMGSVAEKVVRHAACPVLTVRLSLPNAAR